MPAAVLCCAMLCRQSFRQPMNHVYGMAHCVQCAHASLKPAACHMPHMSHGSWRTARQTSKLAAFRTLPTHAMLPPIVPAEFQPLRNASFRIRYGQHDASNTPASAIYNKVAGGKPLQNSKAHTKEYILQGSAAAPPATAAVQCRYKQQRCCQSS